MALFVKTNPINIDIPIQALQTSLYNSLLAKWGIGADDYEAYGRCYKNHSEDKGGFVAEVFKSGKEYQEVYLNDKVKALSFFGVGESVKFGKGFSADVHLVFFVNLAALKPDIAHRADEEVRDNVFTLVNGRNGFTVNEVVTGVERSLAEYNGTRRSDNLRYRADMQPWHIFRLNMNINYTQQYCS